MRTYELTHLDNDSLLLGLAELIGRDRANTADLLAHIAEVQARRLYLPAAHPSMLSYCVHVLRLSEDSALKRIRAARAARKFPAIFTAVAEGALTLSAVVALSPYLKPGNAEELLKAAAHKTRSEIEEMLACRFPRSEMLALVEAIPSPKSSSHEAAPRSFDPSGSEAPKMSWQTDQVAPGPVSQCAESREAVAESELIVPTEGPGIRPSEPLMTKPVGSGSPRAPIPTSSERLAPKPERQLSLRSNVAAVAPERFALHVSIARSTYEHLKQAQALLGHAVPSGDIAEVIDRALKSLVRELEKRKLAATDRPRPPRRASRRERSTSADVRRAVWERDQGQCAYIGESGQRCPERRGLELDHVLPLAHGGPSTTDNLRLLCRAHNAYAAECVFGASFIERKRNEARRKARGNAECA